MSTEVELNIKDRPKSVFVISTLLIIISIVGWVVIVGTFVYVSTQSNIRLQSPAHFLLGPTISSGLQIVIGIGMLKGRNWARNLFFWLIPISIIVGLVLGIGGGGLIVKVVWYSIFVYFLTRPKVSSYFTVTK